MTRSARIGPATPWLSSLGTLLVALTLAWPAAADPKRAIELSREADELMSAGKYDEACPKLAESLRIDPRSATALELGECYQQADRPGSAYRAFGDAIELGKKEKRNDRVNRARTERNKLTFKIARVVVRVPPTAKVDGLVVRIDEQPLPESAHNASFESDPGARSIVAEAPGRERWEKKVTLRAGNNAPITIPTLKEATGKPAPQPAPAPSAPPQPVAKDPPQPEVVEEEVPEEPPPPTGEHEANRLVVEIGAMGGLLYSNVVKGRLSELFGVNYEFQSAGGSLLLAECGDPDTIPGAGECEAEFDDVARGLVGGNLFIGWAVHEDVHLGARGMGGALLSPKPQGFFFAGGPSVSGRVVGPLWLGASFLLGLEQHRSQLVSARGSVPPEYRAANQGQSQVDIPLSRLDFSEGDVDSGILVGGALEIAVSIVGPDPHAAVPTDNDVPLLSGSLMVGLWPAGFWAQEGFAIALPAGFGYRFH